MNTQIRLSASDRGVTLLELSVVILVLITLISVLFLGAQAYKEGADRSNCVMNIRNVQVAVRCYQNIYHLDPGDEINQAVLIGDKSGFLKSMPNCPGDGDYTLTTEIPDTGQLALDCSIEGGLEHTPKEHSSW